MKPLTKILFYAINGRGMGHLNRTLVLGRALRHADPELQVEFVVGSPLLGMVQGAGFPVCKIPDAHHPLGMIEGMHRRHAEQDAMFEVLLDALLPDVFVVDFALSTRTFRAATDRGARVALVYRKQPHRELQRWQHDAALQHVRHFLLPHTQRELAPGELPKHFRQRAVFLGPLARELDAEAIPDVRRQYARAGQRLVVVSIGGGGFEESYQTLRAAEGAAARLTETESGEPIQWVLVYGPYFKQPVPASDGHVTRLRYESRLLELFAAADLVVCNAGYNTILELGVCGTPGIVIPLGATGRDDQLARARECAQRGEALLSGSDEAELVERVRDVLDRRRLAPRPRATTSRSRELGRTLLDAFRL